MLPQQPQTLHPPSHPAAATGSHHQKLRDQNASLARHNTTLALRLRATREKLDRERASFIHAHSHNVHLMSRVRTLEQELQRANEAIERMQRAQFRSEQQKGEMQRLTSSTEQVFGSMIAHLRAMADNLETNVLSAWSEMHTALDQLDLGEPHPDTQLYLPPMTHGTASSIHNHSRRSSIASTSSMASSPNPNDSVMSYGSEIDDLDVPDSPSALPSSHGLKRQNIHREARFPRTLPEDLPKPLFPPESPASHLQSSAAPDPWAFSNTDPSQTHGQTNLSHLVREIEVPCGSNPRPPHPPTSTWDHHFTQKDNDSNGMDDVEMTDTIGPLSKPTVHARGGGTRHSREGRARGGARSTTSSRRRSGNAWNAGSGFVSKAAMATAGSRRSHPPSDREVRAKARAATKLER